jgi:mannose-6-phosphate isomerase-like protein (cupin superfamily)
MGEKPMKTRYADAEAYVTKDGSVIRELMHPALHGSSHGCTALSLAEARVSPGASTQAHLHPTTEEHYHFTAGSGIMTLGEERFAVLAGDTVAIPPGSVHKVENNGRDELVILCCCSPAYSHDDTVLTETEGE